MTTLKPLTIVGLSAVLLATAIQPVTAAVINWGTPTLISGTGDQVVTTGSLFAAANFGSGTNVTVNGVTFNAFQIAGTPTGTAASWTSGVFTVAGTGTSTQFLENLNTSGTGSGTPYELLGDTPYRAVAAGSAVARSNNPMQITISGLTPSTEYLIQYWASDSRFSGGARTVTLDATNSVVLDVNSTNTTGGLGQWVTGTFTANATSQSIGVVGSTALPTTYVNAIQIRVVPEPSTLAVMVAAGGTATMVRLRRARKGAAPAASA